MEKEGGNRRLTLVIVDNQSIFRKGLCDALSGYEDMQVIGESPLSMDAWFPVENLLPDVVLVGIGASLSCGFSVVRQIATRCPRVAVVILSPSAEDEHLFQSIKSGAAAFLGRDIAIEDLVGILRKVRRGGIL